MRRQIQQICLFILVYLSAIGAGNAADSAEQIELTGGDQIELPDWLYPAAIQHLTFNESGTSVWLAKDNVLHVGAAGKPLQSIQAITLPEGQIRKIRWSGSQSVLVTLRQHNQQDVLYSVHLDLEEVSQLYHQPLVAGFGLRVLARDGDEWLVAVPGAVPDEPDIVAVHNRHGTHRYVLINPGKVFRWYVDERGEITAGHRWRAAGSDIEYELIWREGTGLPWRTAYKYRLGELDLRVRRVSAAGQYFEVLTHRANNQSALERIDFSTGRNKPILQRAGAAILAARESGRNWLIKTHTSGENRWEALEPSALANLPELGRQRLYEGEDGSAVVYEQSWHDTGTYTKLRAEGDSQVLGTSYAKGPELSHATRELFRFKARDGLMLHGFVSRPAGAQQLPGVLLIHGGPWSHDAMRFDAEARLLADAGFAVIQVNFRGSAGLGFDLREAGRRAWVSGMQQDLIDALDFSRRSGWIGERVCAMGSSYGGFAGLLLATHDEAKIDCVIARAPVTNPGEQIDHFRAIKRNRAVAEWHAMVGHPAVNGELFARADLEARATEIEVPILLAHGSADLVVPPKQSKALLAALPQDRTHWIDLPGEAHTLREPENITAFYQQALVFLQRHLANGN